MCANPRKKSLPPFKAMDADAAATEAAAMDSVGMVAVAIPTTIVDAVPAENP